MAIVWPFCPAAAGWRRPPRATRAARSIGLVPDGNVESVRHGVGHQRVDHADQALGRIRGCARPGRARCRSATGVDVDELVHDFGAADDDAERILQVVRDLAEDLALERVGVAQPLPLRLEPPVGGGELARALHDPLLEARVRALQLLVEDDVVESDRQRLQNTSTRARSVSDRSWRLRAARRPRGRCRSRRRERSARGRNSWRRRAKASRTALADRRIEASTGRAR